jgi:hypothetical protein
MLLGHCSMKLLATRYAVGCDVSVTVAVTD